MTRRAKKEPITERGSIRADEVYPLSVACRRLGWGRKTWWSARDAGLRSVSHGRQVYLLGEDILNWFRSQAARQAEGEQ